MKIAIYGSRHQDDFVNDITKTVVELAHKGYTLLFHRKVYDYLLSWPLDEETRLTLLAAAVDETGHFEADLALSIGGDGTFLRTAQWIAEKEIPIIGVNTGHLGFLAPFTLAEVTDTVEAFRTGHADILDRGLIRFDAMGDFGSFWPYALNEVAVLKKDTASMISVTAQINRSPLATYKCDGLLVSTPTGSTGYNLSVGGPIVEPGSPIRIISPVAAHSLTMRPLVVSADSLLEMRVSSRANAFRISLDGRSITLPAGTSFFISKGEFVVKSVCKPNCDFYATIREKLLWGTPSGQ